MNARVSTVMLSATLTVFPASAQLMQGGSTVSIISGTGDNTLPHDTLYTESNWQKVQLSPEAVSHLGNLSQLQLEVRNLPANVKVKLSTKASPPNTVGLEVSRVDKAVGVRQLGLFVLTNPETRKSFAFEVMVTGAGR